VMKSMPEDTEMAKRGSRGRDNFKSCTLRVSRPKSVNNVVEQLWPSWNLLVNGKTSEKNVSVRRVLIGNVAIVEPVMS